MSRRRSSSSAACYRGDRRHRVALLDEDVEHATGERRTHRRVAELHVQRGEPRLGLREQRCGLLAACARFVLALPHAALRARNWSMRPCSMPRSAARCAPTRPRRGPRDPGLRAGRAPARSRPAPAPPCRSLRRGSSGSSRRARLYLTSRSGSTVPVATTMRSMRPASTGAVATGFSFAPREQPERPVAATRRNVGNHAPDPARDHGGTSLRACNATVADGADAIGGRVRSKRAASIGKSGGREAVHGGVGVADLRRSPTQRGADFAARDIGHRGRVFLGACLRAEDAIGWLLASSLAFPVDLGGLELASVNALCDSSVIVHSRQAVGPGALDLRAVGNRSGCDRSRRG